MSLSCLHNTAIQQNNGDRTMAKTRHIHKRMSQRGINSRLIDMVSQYGVKQRDKYMLNRKQIDALLSGMDEMRKMLLKIRDKGGIVLVETEDCQITTYNLNSYNYKKRKH